MHTTLLNFRKAILMPLLFLAISVKAYTVTNLVATTKNGQVFLTWESPKATNLKYKVYRSSSIISSTSQLSDSNYLGYVRDNSAKNIRKSTLEGEDFYFIINPFNGPLASTSGLYVATCSDNKKYYYAVTVVNLSTNKEAKTITPGSNSLNFALKGQIGNPKPILQNMITQENGDINYEYVIWGNNQDVWIYPAFNNCGSYGYNFTFVSRNPGTAGPLYIKFQDEDPFGQVGSEECDDCNILVLDDWMPNGENSYWVGFNTNYDMYSSINSIQTNGRIRAYTQHRLRKIVEWCITNPKVDATRVYASGFSHNGFGALFSSIMMSDLIAATQENAAPILIKAVNGSWREQQWCDANLNLNSDVTDPEKGDTLLIWDLLDIRTMLQRNENRSLPFMCGVNGKQDVTVGWVNKFYWYDSVNVSRHGGLWFWDQRNHTGDGKNFSTDETNLDFLRFATNKSYPAFSYCSINQDPGNGSVNHGDPYGALNGYLDWDDNSIIDLSCAYSIQCLIKDFYVGGVKQKKYDSCVTDVTLRRLQNFHPVKGQVIFWVVTKSNNQTVQQGSFVYDSDKPVTLYGIKIYKAGSSISLRTKNCEKEESTYGEETQKLVVARTFNGYQVSLQLTAASYVEVNVTDMSGRTVSKKLFSGQAGDNSFSIVLNPGAYILQVKATGLAESRKLVF